MTREEALAGTFKKYNKEPFHLQHVRRSWTHIRRRRPALVCERAGAGGLRRPAGANPAARADDAADFRPGGARPAAAGGVLPGLGLLHDVDFEQWPEQHCAARQKGRPKHVPGCSGSWSAGGLRPAAVRPAAVLQPRLRPKGVCSDGEPVLEMEKVLFAGSWTARRTVGLVGAAALMRPSRKAAQDDPAFSHEGKFERPNLMEKGLAAG